MTIGILGLQGCTVPHHQKFAALGVPTKRVLYPHDFADVDGLVLPGGESTTMLKTATDGLWDALREFAASKPVWGICAGCILMATQVEHPAQTSLGLIDITVSRNAYGSQIDSFCTQLPLQLAEPATLPCIFIRAPRILRVGEGLKVLASHRDDPVMVRSDRHLVTTFHPELTDHSRIHQYFSEWVAANRA